MFCGHRCRTVLSLLAALVVSGCGSSQASGQAAEIASPQSLDGTVGVVSEVVSPEADEDDADAGGVGPGETPPGSGLDLGEAATLAMTSSGKRGVVSAAVEVTRGDPADVAGLDGVEGDVDPYYVTITFENVGDNEMPYASLDNDFHGLLSDGSPAREPGTAEGFRPCEAVPAPGDFRKGKTYESCRVFLAPAGERVRTVAYEGFETPYADDPVTWGP